MADLRGAEKYKLGKSANITAGSYHGVIKPNTSNAFDVNRGPTGYGANTSTQFSFLKGNSVVGDSTLHPANRIAVRAADRNLKERLAQSVNAIGLTEKQIRINMHNNSGTSIPKTTQFNYTTDYQRLVETPSPVEAGFDLFGNSKFQLAALILIVGYFYMRR